MAASRQQSEPRPNLSHFIAPEARAAMRHKEISPCTSLVGPYWRYRPVGDLPSLPSNSGASADEPGIEYSPVAQAPRSNIWQRSLQNGRKAFWAE
jgi:hypothetical protein